MKLLKISSLLLFLFSIFSFNFVLAETTNTKTEAIILAEVNIYNAKITSQESNKFKISFDLVNKKINQPDVLYGLKLLREDGKKQYLVDEKIYDEKLYLRENSTISKNIEYIAPGYLNGDYTILLTSYNKSGFPFAFQKLSQVKLSGTEKGIVIDNQSCYLTILKDKSFAKYNLIQGIDITKEEELILNCLIKNETGSTIELLPNFETHHRSSFGDIVDTIGGDKETLILNANNKQNLSIKLPKALNPQAYNIKFYLKNEKLKTNELSIQYVLSGGSATIQNILLDKSFYERGEVAKVSLLWSGSADSFPGSRTSTINANNTIMAEVSILNKNDKVCAFLSDYDLTAGSIKAEIPLEIKTKCTNPKVITKLSKKSGEILDTKEFNFVSDIQNNNINIKIILISLFILLILVIIIIYFIKKSKSKNIIIPSLFILLFLSFGLLISNKTEAATYYLADTLFTVNLDKGSYSMDDTMNITGSMWYYGCGNEVIMSAQSLISLFPGLGDYGYTLVQASTSNPSGIFEGDNTIYGSMSTSVSFLNPYKGYENSIGAMGAAQTSMGYYTESQPVFLDYYVKETPAVTVNSDSSTIFSGNKVNISWSSGKDVTHCYCSYSGGDGNCGSGAGTNIKAKNNPYTLTETTTFRVSCDNN